MSDLPRCCAAVTHRSAITTCTSPTGAIPSLQSVLARYSARDRPDWLASAPACLLSRRWSAGDGFWCAAALYGRRRVRRA